MRMQLMPLPRQDFEPERRLAVIEEVPTDAKEPSPRSQAVFAVPCCTAGVLAMMATHCRAWAMEAMEARGSLHLTSLLQPQPGAEDQPIDMKHIAKAYTLARAEFKEGAKPTDLQSEQSQGPLMETDLQECSLRALRVLRDVLVLQMCMGHGPWDNKKLWNAMEELFLDKKKLLLRIFVASLCWPSTQPCVSEARKINSTIMLKLHMAAALLTTRKSRICSKSTKRVPTHHRTTCPGTRRSLGGGPQRYPKGECRKRLDDDHDEAPGVSKG